MTKIQHFGIKLGLDKHFYLTLKANRQVSANRLIEQAFKLWVLNKRSNNNQVIESETKRGRPLGPTSWESTYVKELVLWIANVGYGLIPTSPTVAALVALCTGWTSVPDRGVLLVYGACVSPFNRLRVHHWRR